KVGREIPWSAVGVYTYLSERIGVGLKQLLAGARKFRLDLIDRSDIAALTKLASEVTGIPMLHEIETELFEAILTS
ncbi:MAG: FMN-binding glutamate synthase family protein, partial [Candidatus Alkanophagales archaeon]